jgi:2',3'-cyclic-nucleotide 2'-phosphodiesterase (5'-nucleotidase family)
VEATGVRVVSNLADKATGKLFAPPSMHLKAGNVECVIAGVTTDQLAQYRAAVRPMLDVTDPVVWAKNHFPQIFASDAAPIVMSHAGLRTDRAIFSLVPDGTLVVGAHDHLRFVHEIGRTVYVHSGSWNSHFSIVQLSRSAAGFHWQAEQVAIEAGDPVDPELAEVIQRVEQKNLNADDLVVLGELDRARSRAEAARWVAQSVAKAAGADAAFIGNTTFGAGLPAGNVSRVALDACVRFDGTICIARVTGAQLREWMGQANETPETPFEQRRGEFLFGDGPTNLDDERTYTIATTDWGMKNRERYFGHADLVFEEHPELRLKTIVAEALKHER